MSGISLALSNALSGLMSSAGQTVVTSRNITNVNNENYSREISTTSTGISGGAKLDPTQRVADKKLLDSFLQSSSIAAGQSTLLDAVTTLSNTVGDVQSDGSVAWSIDQFQQKLQAAEADPSNATLASQVIAGAKTLAATLNSASQITQGVRNDADAGISKSVANINDLLTQFQKLDNSIASNTLDPDTRASAMDSRDAILKKLSAEVGIQTVNRPDNSIAIYTDGGVTLYDKTPRTLTFAGTNSLTPGVSGVPVYADGVQITGANSPMPSKSGNLVAFAQIRDQVAPTYQNQLDEIARALVNNFAETDQTATPSQPDATGLFSYSGSPAVPGATLIPGLASQITVNSAYDPSAGGTATLLRDGGVNGAAYKYNTTNVSGFQTRLKSLMQSMSQTQSFSTTTQLPGTNTIIGLATSSAGWLEATRSDADTKSTNAQASLTRTKAALLSQTGVNLDAEMATMLNLEKSYQASAKILTTVDQMLGDLLQTVR
jgi:flagellar hook-associated protein 1 FlgK